MIKCNEGNVEITGSKATVMTEFSTLVHAMHYELFIGEDKMTAEESRKEILEAVELGFLTFDESKKKLACDVKSEILKALDELKELLCRKDDE